MSNHDKDSLPKLWATAVPDDLSTPEATYGSPKMSLNGIPYVVLTNPGGVPFGDFHNFDNGFVVDTGQDFLLVTNANLIYNPDETVFEVQTHILRSGWDTGLATSLNLAATGAVGFSAFNNNLDPLDNEIRPNNSWMIDGADPSDPFDPTLGNGVHNFMGTTSILFGLNGATFDPIKTASADNLGAQSGVGALLQSAPGEWAINHTPAAATQATITRAAGGAGVRHVCKSITATLIGLAAAAEATILVNLRDGATGAGTILWSTRLLVTGTTGSETGVALAGLNIVGSENTAMTLEFAAAGAANTFQSVALSGFDTV